MTLELDLFEIHNGQLTVYAGGINDTESTEREYDVQEFYDWLFETNSIQVPASFTSGDDDYIPCPEHRIEHEFNELSQDQKYNLITEFINR